MIENRKTDSSNYHMFSSTSRTVLRLSMTSSTRHPTTCEHRSKSTTNETKRAHPACYYANGTCTHVYLPVTTMTLYSMTNGHAESTLVYTRDTRGGGVRRCGNVSFSYLAYAPHWARWMQHAALAAVTSTTECMPRVMRDAGCWGSSGRCSEDTKNTFEIRSHLPVNEWWDWWRTDDGWGVRWRYCP
jgi:hypothetical protein